MSMVLAISSEVGPKVPHRTGGGLSRAYQSLEISATYSCFVILRRQWKNDRQLPMPGR